MLFTNCTKAHSLFTKAKAINCFWFLLLIYEIIIILLLLLLLLSCCQAQNAVFSAVNPLTSSITSSIASSLASSVGSDSSSPTTLSTMNAKATPFYPGSNTVESVIGEVTGVTSCGTPPIPLFSLSRSKLFRITSFFSEAPLRVSTFNL